MPADYQFVLNGLTIGVGTPYVLEALTGLEGFDARTNDQVLPQLWGVQPGADYAQPRSVTIQVRTLGPNAAVEQAFEAAWLPPTQEAASQLTTLAFKMLGLPELQIAGRVRRRARLRGVEDQFFIPRWVVQFDAPDPRLYAYTAGTVAASPFTADGAVLEYSLGTGVDAAFDYTLGSGVDAAFSYLGITGLGTVTCVNDGNVTTYPSFSFTSPTPMNAWRIVNDTTGQQVSFVFPLTGGGAVSADMAAKATGIIDPPVVTNGSPNYAAWQVPRSPLGLAPGINLLRFVVDAGPTSGPAALITWRSAYL